MRPRHYCRGRPCWSAPRKSARLTSFNEAAALLPREAVCKERRSSSLSPRFNEAAALLPREARGNGTKPAVCLMLQ